MSSFYLLDAAVLMVILAASALCVSVYLRTSTQYESATVRHKSVALRVEELKIATERREREVRLLKTDPETIESCARQELGFVRSDDVVIKLAPEQERRAPDATPRTEKARLTPHSTGVYTGISH